jgi:hypothetical protein
MIITKTTKEHARTEAQAFIDGDDGSTRAVEYDHNGVWVLDVVDDDGLVWARFIEKQAQEQHHATDRHTRCHRQQPLGYV